jgi:hypothetical protein
MSTWSRRNPGADTIGRLPGRDQRESSAVLSGSPSLAPAPPRSRAPALVPTSVMRALAME